MINSQNTNKPTETHSPPIINISKNFMSKNNEGSWAMTIDEIFCAIQQGTYAHLDKSNRPCVSQSTKDSRPTNDLKSLAYWNGLFVVDIDIKNERVAKAIIKHYQKYLYKLKHVLWVTLSTSGNGIHIYTLVRPPITQADDMLSLEFMRQEYENVTSKTMYFAMSMLTLAIDEYHTSRRYGDEDAELNEALDFTHNPKLFDKSTAKLSQLVAISSYSDIAINPNFIYDMFTDDSDYVQAVKTDKTLSYETKQKLLEDATKATAKTLQLQNDINGHQNFNYDRNSIQFPEDEMSNTDALLTKCKKIHLDNDGRYRLAYTLAFIWQITSTKHEQYNAVLAIFLRILSGSHKFMRERHQYVSIFNNAVDRQRRGMGSYNVRTVNMLRDVHDWDIKVKIDTKAYNEVIAAKNSNEDIIAHLSTAPDIVEPNTFVKFTKQLTIDNDQYLTKVFYEILDEIKFGVNLICAPAGSGKTVFVSKLAKRGKVLLTEPFTSIIKSKFENDVDSCFLSVYGNTKLMQRANMSSTVATIDKFANLSKSELNELANSNEYIVFDESHLHNTSAYRNITMSNAIDNINYIAAHFKTKIIFLTGTPSAEHIFHRLSSAIKVSYKTLKHSKKHDIIFVNDVRHKKAKLIIDIIRAIEAGKKVMLPSNRGDKFFMSIIQAVSEYLGRPVRYHIYSRKNVDTDDTLLINDKKLLGDIEILFVTTFFSVGNDLLDSDVMKNCVIFYDDDMTANDIEQFNNRFRQSDIHSYEYKAMHTAEGNAIDITRTEDLIFATTLDEQLEGADYINYANAVNSRMQPNSDEYDYFSEASRKSFINIDPHTKTAHFNKTAFLNAKFAERYNEWSSQPQVVKYMLETMYNYEVNIVFDTEHAKEDVDYIVDLIAKHGKKYKEEREQARFTFFNEILKDPMHFNNLVNNAYPINYTSFVGAKRLEDQIIYGSPYVEDAQSLVKCCKALTKVYKPSTIIKIIENKCVQGERIIVANLGRIATNAKVRLKIEDSLTSEPTFAFFEVLADAFSCAENGILTFKDKYDYDKLVRKAKMAYDNVLKFSAQSVAYKESSFNQAKELSKSFLEKVGTKRNTYAIFDMPEFDSNERVNETITQRILDDFVNSTKVELNEEQTQVLTAMFDKSVKSTKKRLHVLFSRDKRLEEFSEEMQMLEENIAATAKHVIFESDEDFKINRFNIEEFEQVEMSDFFSVEARRRYLNNKTPQDKRQFEKLTGETLNAKNLDNYVNSIKVTPQVVSAVNDAYMHKMPKTKLDDALAKVLDDLGLS